MAFSFCLKITCKNIVEQNHKRGRDLILDAFIHERYSIRNAWSSIRDSADKVRDPRRCPPSLERFYSCRRSRTPSSSNFAALQSVYLYGLFFRQCSKSLFPNSLTQWWEAMVCLGYAKTQRLIPLYNSQSQEQQTRNGICLNQVWDKTQSRFPSFFKHPRPGRFLCFVSSN